MSRRDWYCEDVLSGKIAVKKIWEDEYVLAFHHPTPTAPIHAVIIPKKHISSIMASEAVDGMLLTSMVTAVQKVAVETGLNTKGFFVRTNAINAGVTPHMHWHVMSMEK
jgi:histidine triad (HIT) family protein